MELGLGLWGTGVWIPGLWRYAPRSLPLPACVAGARPIDRSLNSDCWTWSTRTVHSVPVTIIRCPSVDNIPRIWTWKWTCTMDMDMDMGREEQIHASQGDTVPALLLIDVRRNHTNGGGGSDGHSGNRHN